MDIIFDIETAPLTVGEYVKVGDDGEKKDIGGLSPITGKIIAIGMHAKKTHIFTGEENDILTNFWQTIREESEEDKGFFKLVGFNVKQFDIHFLIVRSLAHNVPILKFNRRYVIDLREYLTFFQTYMKKGTLNDYARIIGVEGKYNDLENKDIPILYQRGDFETIRKYLEQDIAMTKNLYDACKKVGILELG